MASVGYSEYYHLHKSDKSPSTRLLHDIAKNNHPNFSRKLTSGIAEYANVDVCTKISSAQKDYYSPELTGRRTITTHTDGESALIHIKQTFGISIIQEESLKAFIVDQVTKGLRTISNDLLIASEIIVDNLQSTDGTAEMRLFVDQEDATWKSIMLTIYVKDKSPEQILDLQHTIYGHIREKIRDLAKCLLVRVLPYQVSDEQC